MRNTPPSAEHWLGTDRNGRDVYARLVKGGQVSLAAGFAAVVIIMSIGVALGAAAGFFGGWVDAFIMRFTDILLSIPLLLLLITAASLFTPGLQTTVIIIGLLLVAGRGPPGPRAVPGAQGAGVRDRGPGDRRLDRPGS